MTVFQSYSQADDLKIMIYNPVSTYRIQFSGNFAFKDLVKIIPYLNEIGVKTIYASPIFGAVPGSEHGYDITDPLNINPEIGTLEEFRSIHQQLKILGMGWIQDIVPNHMAFSVHNPWIQDILEAGKESEYSDYFDINWQHPDERLNGKIMLPFLSKPLEKLIETGEISVVWRNKHFILKNYDNEFPLSYDSYPLILNKSRKKSLPDGLTKLVEIFKRAKNDTEAGKNGKKMLAEKYDSDKNFRDCINENLHAINKDKNSLIELIGSQHYVPVCWKESEKVLNYRRFFTINGMICLRIEQKHVFDGYHSFIDKLCKENLLQGLRVDHIDGLYDPGEYLDRLRELAGRNKYITVEKILDRDECIEKSWPVQGETGYYFLAIVNNLLTSEKSEQLIDNAYKYWNNKQPDNYDEVLYQKKRYILYQQMAGDLDNLYSYFISLNIIDLKLYDPVKIKAAIGEFLLNCPVYKIYNSPGNFNDQQLILLNGISEITHKRAPHLADELHLLKEIFSSGKNFSRNKTEKINAFFKRSMQLTGPLMAKGAEDTAYYTFNRFIGHNEVGDSPACFGISDSDFHDEMIKRQNHYPLSLNATSTHDTKRGEDARARLMVLSDVPKLWNRLAKHWHKVNRRFKIIHENKENPNLTDEYFIYQTIVGFMPEDMLPDDDFEGRLVNYIKKALREGKMESDWSEPNLDYESNTQLFIHSILSGDSEFRKSLKPFLDKVAYLGILNSISQILLKFTAPGVPDIYQGSESWNFSFVDPDNRRPVDFAKLAKLLSDIKRNKSGISRKTLFTHEIKILLVNLLLELRKKYPEIFEKGEYIPLKEKGKLKHMVLAYARRYGETTIILAIPRHLGELFDNEKVAGIKAIEWEDTRIDIPDFFPDEYENLLTGRKLKSDNSLKLSVLFSEIPFGLMKGYRKVSERKAGILMHITSLPGKYPIGDFGPEAYNFADFLKRNGQSYWQVLPLNQTYKQGGYSPYSALSAFAGNIYFISPDLLAEQNMIRELPEKMKSCSTEKVNYPGAENLKEEIIQDAFKYFKNGSFLSLKNDFDEFREKEKYWLHDYSIFITLKKRFHFSRWNEWPKALRDHDERAVDLFCKKNYNKIEREEFAQFIFKQQWKALKAYCNDRGIKIFGDIPIYVNYDSADVWSHPEFFKLKKNKEMQTVAGVPPDYFSKSGQLWNMPVFKWDIMKNDGFTWWKNRIKKNLELFDLLRLDHFRAFSAFWEVPADELTAVNGKWVEGPGVALFDELKKEFPDMPFVAEDLGEIDQQVYDLRDKYTLPGMRVLQFAFGKDIGNSVHSLHNHTYDSIVYTGTHDNNTIRGWYKNETEPLHRKNLKNYLGRKVTYPNCHSELIRLAYSSVAKLVIIPLQDILGLDTDARMNIPSVPNDNWLWRLSKEDMKPDIEKKITTLVKTFGRI